MSVVIKAAKVPGCLKLHLTSTMDGMFNEIV